MKIIILLTFLFCTVDTFSQCQNSILFGKWKVVGAFNGEIYFNLKTDSVSITKDIIEEYPDTLMQNKFISTSKTFYTAISFIFENNGEFKQYLDTNLLINDKYCFLPSKNILQLSSKNSLGEVITDNATAKIENSLLYFSQFWDSERQINLILEKID